MLGIFRPQLVIPRLEHLDCRELLTRGVRGVMIDLDNTLAPWRSTETSSEVESWVECMHETGLRACVVTNAANADRVRPVAERLRLPWVIRAIKPFSGGFRRGMQLLGTAPHETAMVGDMLLTDILGGNRLGLYTVLVEPMCAREAWLATCVQRPLERFLTRFLHPQRYSFPC